MSLFIEKSPVHHQNFNPNAILLLFSFTLSLGVQTPPPQRGVMSRAFEQIFENIQTTDVTYYVVRASYLEIYNEDIRDLLNKKNQHKLELKEHPERGRAQSFRTLCFLYLHILEAILYFLLFLHLY